MTDFKITKIKSRWILDSRGNPTVETDVYCGKEFARAAVPSGASTGVLEALELRDGGEFFLGKHVSKAVSNVLYNSVDELAQGVKVNINSLKEFAKPLAERASTLGNIEAEAAGDNLVRAVMDLPDELDYATDQDLRHRLWAKNQEFEVVNKHALVRGRAKKLTELTDEAIREALPKDALKAWDEANVFYKGWQTKYNNRGNIGGITAIGDVGYYLVFAGELAGADTYSIRFIKNNVYTSITGLKKYDELESFGKIIESRVR